MQRIAVVGTSGSGKTTLGGRLAEYLGYPFVDIDPIIWGPNWTLQPDDQIYSQLDNSLSGSCWVTSGNTSRFRPLIWGRADTLIWLDYPLVVILWRLWWRTLRRILTREELWAGNRESFRNQFFSRDSLLLYAIQTYPRRKQEFPRYLAMPEYAHLNAIRLPTPRATEKWLTQIPPGHTAANQK